MSAHRDRGRRALSGWRRRRGRGSWQLHVLLICTGALLTALGLQVHQAMQTPTLLVCLVNHGSTRTIHLQARTGRRLSAPRRMPSAASLVLEDQPTPLREEYAVAASTRSWRWWIPNPQAEVLVFIINDAACQRIEIPRRPSDDPRNLHWAQSPLRFPTVP